MPKTNAGTYKARIHENTVEHKRENHDKLETFKTRHRYRVRWSPRCQEDPSTEAHFAPASALLQHCFSFTSALLQPYFSPTSALLQLYFNSTSTLLQLYFNSTSALLPPRHLRRGGRPPCSSHASALLQLSLPLLQPYFSSTSTLLQPYFSPTSAARRPYVSPTSVIVNHAPAALQPK